MKKAVLKFKKDVGLGNNDHVGIKTITAMKKVRK